MSFLMDNFNLQPRGFGGAASPHLGGSLLTEPPSSSAITMGDETGPSSQTPRHAPNLSHRLNPPREAINRLIMNYLVTEGFKEAAEKFQNEANVSLPDDVGDMDNRIKIRNAIQTGQIRDAILIVHQLYPELLDDDRYLFFHLQQQQLIELIRESRVEEALKFASEQLAERGEEDPAILEELERTMALLAFENPEQSPFANLLSASHRQKEQVPSSKMTGIIDVLMEIPFLANHCTLFDLEGKDISKEGNEKIQEVLSELLPPFSELQILLKSKNESVYQIQIPEHQTRIDTVIKEIEGKEAFVEKVTKVESPTSQAERNRIIAELEAKLAQLKG